MNNLPTSEMVLILSALILSDTRTRQCRNQMIHVFQGNTTSVVLPDKEALM